jgi:hypothetical protein
MTEYLLSSAASGGATGISTTAELAGSNVTEGNKTCKANAGHASRPAAVRSACLLKQLRALLPKSIICDGCVTRFADLAISGNGLAKPARNRDETGAKQS